MKTRIKKGQWIWACQGGDSRRGCWHPDWEGRCESRSRKGFKNQSDAVRAGDLHLIKCRFKGPILVLQQL